MELLVVFGSLPVSHCKSLVGKRIDCMHILSASDIKFLSGFNDFFQIIALDIIFTKVFENTDYQIKIL